MRLQASNISKHFGRTRALSDVSIELRPGKIHALVGENGAGKSTLLKILAGAEQMDAGEMMLDDMPYRPRNLREAERHRVALVFQELTINPSLGIAENIYIDRLRRFANRIGWIDRAALEREAQAMLDKIDVGISVRQSLQSLNLGQWKCIEVCRALANKPQILFFDESTAYLGLKEVEMLLGVMTRLRARGLTIAFVSHHLDEVTDHADDLTILKDGRLVCRRDCAGTTTDEIHALMVGREVSSSIYPLKSSLQGEKPMLEVTGLKLDQADAAIDLTLNRGEVLGIGGLKGAGGEELVSILCGDKRLASGTITFDGAPYAPKTPIEAWKAGIAYLPGDRGGEGLIGDFPILENLILGGIPRRGIWVDRTVAKDLAATMIQKLHIRPNDPSLPVKSLSGGNMQKVVLGKCIVTRPRILLLNNPTRGVDIGAREQIYKTIRKMAEAGTAVVLLSEDLSELIGMSDRLIVMRRGAITREFGAAGKWAEEDVIQHMV
jgi:ABC-type sugar transport system ATPase subunit